MRLGLLFIPLLTSLNISCQEAPAAAVPEYSRYSFLRIAQNRLRNDSLLFTFYKKLHGLKTGDSQGQYNIVHIGDSHLQADFRTAVSRTGLQTYFGNAGRGLILPHKLTKSNEALDYWLKTQANFRYERLLKNKKMFAVGPGGLALRFDGTNPVVPIDILLKPDSVLDYSFSRVRMLGMVHKDYAGELRVSTTENKLLFSGSFIPGETVQLAQKTLDIYFDVENKDHKYLDLHGFVLSNEQPGLLYHTIGINGARYIDYRRNPAVMQGWGQLKPDLFILSLGTNEVILWKFNQHENYLQLDSFFREFRSLYPRVPVIIELPFDGKFGRARTNARLPLLNANLLRIADTYGAAIYDGYHAGGGYGSAYYWARAGLLNSDGIHFTREGYRVQGDMLKDAIFNGYKDRFPDYK